MPVTPSKRTTLAKARSPQSPQRWQPHAYQRKAVKFLLEHGGAGLFLDPGLGKTSITLAGLKMLREERVGRGALVIAPLRPAQEVWPEQLQEWADFEDLSWVVLHGAKKSELVKQRKDIYIINLEGLRWLVASGALKELLRKGWIDTLVLDELSKWKHTDTQRYKLLKPFLGKFARRWGLTGSPAARSLLDLFGQIYAIDGGRAFGPYKTHYRMQYFSATGTVQVRDPRTGASKTVSVGWVPKPGAEDLIFEKLKPCVLRMDAKDYLELPELLPHTHYIDLPPAAMKVYTAMEKTLVAMLDDELFTAANTAVAVGKCRQIASGALLRHEIDPITGVLRALDHAYDVVHTAKLDAVLDFIEELQGQPFLCAYEYVHEKDRLVAALGPDTPWIGGGVNKTRAKELLRAWNANELPYLFGHPQSIGHGLNGQKGNAAHVGFFTPPYDYELYDQFIRRVLRQGNRAKHVHVHHFVARHTVDEAAMIMLRRKEKSQQALFEALRTYVRAGKGRK